MAYKGLTEASGEMEGTEEVGIVEVEETTATSHLITIDQAVSVGRWEWAVFRQILERS